MKHTKRCTATLLAGLMLASLTACSQPTTPTDTPVETPTQAPTQAPTPEPPTSSDEPTTWDYDFKYYCIDCKLIASVGEDAFNAWLEETTGQDVNIKAFVEHFAIPEDELRKAVNSYEEYYTDAEIDAIYGRGDMSAFMDEEPYEDEGPCG